MHGAPPRPHVVKRAGLLAVAGLAAVAVAACGDAAAHVHGQPVTAAAASASTSQSQSPGAVAARSRRHRHHGPKLLHHPKRLRAFDRRAAPRQGVWHGVGRKVKRHRAVYETTLVPPGGSQPAGIAWMDTRLLKARLYSGSESPGGGPYRYTAPIKPKPAHTLVAAFNGGFKMNATQGGYYTEGRIVDPLRHGAASLVIYRGGKVNIGPWGGRLKLTRKVVAVRQNLLPLVAHHRPTRLAHTSNWLAWGATCGVSSCSGAGIENQWRSAVGITKDRALVYVQGPGLAPLQLARLLARAGAVRGMELDINPDWPIFATYDPSRPHGLATAANGHGLLPGTVRGPDTFFDPAWARDFITMSARR